jgi:transcription elongation factor GreA
MIQINGAAQYAICCRSGTLWAHPCVALPAALAYCQIALHEGTVGQFDVRSARGDFAPQDDALVRDKRPMDKIPMTRAGFAALETELKQLKSQERPAIIRAIAEAREHGDLSENAEYHSAKEKQSFIEGRIKELEGVIGLAEVIDPSKLSGPIKFGATVTLVDEDTDEEKTWRIVGEYEANIEKGLLNMKSPIARALIGKEEGDIAEVNTPGGIRALEIVEVKYI